MCCTNIWNLPVCEVERHTHCRLPMQTGHACLPFHSMVHAIQFMFCAFRLLRVMHEKLDVSIECAIAMCCCFVAGLLLHTSDQQACTTCSCSATVNRGVYCYHDVCYTKTDFISYLALPMQEGGAVGSARVVEVAITRTNLQLLTNTSSEKKKQDFSWFVDVPYRPNWSGFAGYEGLEHPHQIGRGGGAGVAACAA